MSENDILECRHCAQRVKVKNMMKVPTSKSIMANWINILGEGFKNNLNNNENNYVCLKHFNSPSESVKRRGRKVKIEKVQKNTKKRYPTICRYCDIKCDQKKMSSVPQRADVLAKWIEILGPKFKKNLRGYQRSFICLSHFNIQPGARRKSNDLPVKMQTNTANQLQMPVLKKEPYFGSENGEVEDIPSLKNYEDDQEVQEIDEGELQRIKNAHYVRRTCTFCNASKNEKDMTRVPRNQDLFAEWANILGETFCENVQSRSNFRSFICLTHFDLPNNRRLRKATDLPIKRAGDIPIPMSLKKVKKEVDIPLRKVKKEVEAPLENVKQVAGYSLRKVKKEVGFSLTKVKQEVGFSMKKVKKEAGPKEYIRERLCSFCEEKKKQSLMTRVTENAQILAKWVAILGKNFAKNVKTGGSKYLCLSHFNLPAGVTSRRKHDLPTVLKKVKKEPKKKDVKEPKKSKTPTPPKQTKVKKNQLVVRSQTLRNQLVKLDPVHLSNMKFFGFFYDKKTYKMLRIKTEEPLETY